MPNIIPPIVSSSPPPLDPIEDDDDNDDEDEFGDFAAADIPVDSDLFGLKNGSNTSWKLQNSNPPPEKSCLHENGIPLNVTEIKLPTSSTLKDVLALDTSSSQHAFNTSPDAAVSSTVDSGKCSESQTSNVLPPMQEAAPYDELSSRENLGNLSVCEDDSDSILQNTNNISIIMPLQGELKSFLDLKDSLDTNLSDLPSSDKKSVDVVLSLKSDLPGSSVSSDLIVSHPQLPSEDDTQSKTPPLPRDIENFSSVNSGSFDETEQGNGNLEQVNNLHSSSEACAAPCFNGNVDLSRKSTDSEEDESVKAMIVPEIPISDDDCGDFYKVQLHEFNFDPVDSNGKMLPELESPSRRPTLVLSEDAIQLDTQLSQVTLQQDESFPSHSGETCVNTREKETSASSNVVVDADAYNCSSVIGTESNVSDHSDNDFGEFADFSQAEILFSSEIKNSSGEWAEQSTVQATALECVESADLDEFNDFESAEFQANKTGKDLPSKNVSLFDFNSIKPQLDVIFKELFPTQEGSSVPSEAEHSLSSGGAVSGIVLDVEESPVWQGLRDLESTPSLSFQWPGSHSNRGLLGSLNIDSRNILFGPKWNTVVPRFAANLGFSPLEPVRAVQAQPLESSSQPDCLQAQIEPVSKVVTATSGFQDTVPAAQFDWSDSGLVNPLDSSTLSALLDLDLLATFDSLTSCSPPSLPSPHAAVSCRSVSIAKDQSRAALATTVSSGNPALSSSQLLVPSSVSELSSQDPKLSPEATRILDSLPELAFLSARMLMFPMQNDSNAHKL